MYSIGDVAHLTGLSVRSLRHYDEIGLVAPASVDAHSSYRRYGPVEVARLHRVVALRDLGFSLGQIAFMLRDDVSAAELTGMLRLRQAELGAEIAAANERLERVHATIRRIEQEQTMTTTAIDAVQMPVPGWHLATTSATAPDFSGIGPIVQPLYPVVFRALGEARIVPLGPPVAYYLDADDGTVIVTVGAPVASGVNAVPGLAVVDLAPEPDGVRAYHRGSPASIGDTYAAIMRWIDEHGLVTTSYSREVSLDCPENPDDWVTEIWFGVTQAR